MSKPIIAIVGRPNVGKSMLFNKLMRPAAVHRGGHPRRHPGPDLRRVRVAGPEVRLSWTPAASSPGTDDQILAFMREQAEIAIDNATVIVFVCDVKTGMTASDQEVANMLLRSGKPVVLAVNKVDQVGRENPDIYEFYNLGLGDPIAVSAVHGHGTGDLLDACLQYFPAGGGGGRGGRRHQGGRHRQAQRGQVLPGQPDPGGGAGHRLQRGGHHPGRHGQLL